MIILAAISVYAFLETRDMLNGPEISIISPENMSSQKYGPTEVIGIVRNSSFIGMNGRPILIDKDGNFKEIVFLPRGYNTLTINVKDRFGKEISKTLELMIENEKKDLPISTTTPATLVVIPAQAGI